MRNNGDADYGKLTDHLRNDGNDKIKLTDNKIRKITGSTDKRDPLPLKGDTKYTIEYRANNAGYDVEYDSADKSVKIFTKKK